MRWPSWLQLPVVTRSRFDEAISVAAAAHQRLDAEIQFAHRELQRATEREAYWRDRCEKALDALLARAATAPVMTAPAPSRDHAALGPLAGMFARELPLERRETVD